MRERARGAVLPLLSFAPPRRPQLVRAPRRWRAPPVRCRAGGVRRRSVFFRINKVCSRLTRAFRERGVHAGKPAPAPTPRPSGKGKCDIKKSPQEQGAKSCKSDADCSNNGSCSYCRQHSTSIHGHSWQRFLHESQRSALREQRSRRSGKHLPAREKSWSSPVIPPFPS